MVAKAKASVSGHSPKATSLWLAQVGFNSYAYRLAHWPIPRGALMCALAVVFIFV
jgi:hypothetical protein